jgi:hypothetical protein
MNDGSLTLFIQRDSPSADKKPNWRSAGITARDFWSVTIYDAETRSLLQNGQPKPSISIFDRSEANADGSIDIYFGLSAPAGREKIWVKTVLGQGWFAIVRLDGPLEPFFDQT